MKYNDQLMATELYDYPKFDMQWPNFAHLFSNEINVSSNCDSDFYVQNRILQNTSINIFDFVNDKTDRNLPSPEKFISNWVESNHKKILVVSGGAGVGKTTFVNHFFRNYLCQDKTGAKKLAFINIDIGGVLFDYKDENVDEIFQEMIGRVISYKFADVISGSKDLIQSSCLSSGIEAHKRNLTWLKILSEKYARVIMFVDGIDTLEIKIQEKLLSSVVRLKSWFDFERSIKFIIALRNWDNFHLSNSRFENDFTAIAINPPDPVELIVKKVNDLASRTKYIDIHIQEEIDVLRDLVKKINTPPIMNNLIELSGGNIRNFLHFIERFFVSQYQSKNLDSKKYLLQKNYRWWEVLQGIMLGGYGVYSAKDSKICNLFSFENSSEYHASIIKSQILSTFDERSYWHIKQLSDALQSIGYSDEFIMSSINELIFYGIISIDNKNIGITPSGNYYKNILGYSFPYLQVVATDINFDRDKIHELSRFKRWSVEFGLAIVSFLIQKIARAEMAQMVFISKNKESMSFYNTLNNGESFPISTKIRNNIIKEVKAITYGFSAKNKRSIDNIMVKMLSDLPSDAQQ